MNLLWHCSGGIDVGNPIAGGVDIGNPAAKVKGRIVDEAGRAQSDTEVKLRPVDFNPAKSAASDTLVDTTDASGEFAISRVDSGEYRLNGVHLSNRTRVLIDSIIIQDTATHILKTDTLRQPGTVAIHIPDSLFVAGGILFIPGTDRQVEVKTPGTVFLDSVPAAIIQIQYYAKTADSTIKMDSNFSNITVISGDTVVVQPPELPSGKIRGRIIDNLGQPKIQTLIRCLPAEFNPLNSLWPLDSLLDTTDNNGGFIINGLAAGRYTLSGRQLSEGTQFLIKDILLADHMEHDLGTLDTLRSSGAIQLEITAAQFVPDGWIYVAGTARYQKVPAAGIIVMDSLPAATLNLYYYDSAKKSLIDTLLTAVRVMPGDTVFTVTTFKVPIVDSLFISAAVDSSGNVWFGGWTKGAVKFDGSSWEYFPNKNQGNTLYFQYNEINAITVNKKGEVLFGNSVDVIKFDGAGWQKLFWTFDGFFGRPVTGLAEDLSGLIWAATYHGIFQYDGANLKIFFNSGSNGQNVVESALSDKAGKLWFGTRDSGFIEFDGINWMVFDSTNSPLPANQVTALAQAPGGDLWMGLGISYQGETPIVQWTGSQWILHGSNAPLLQRQQVNAMAFDGGGHLWAVNYKGAHRFDGAVWTSYQIEQGLVNTSLECIAVDRKGQVWVGHRAGISMYNGKRWVNYVPE